MELLADLDGAYQQSTGALPAYLTGRRESVDLAQETGDWDSRAATGRPVHGGSG